MKKCLWLLVLLLLLTAPALAAARFEVLSVSLGLAGVCGPTNDPNMGDIIRARATIRNAGDEVGLCGYDFQEVDAAGERLGSAEDGQDLLRAGESKPVDILLYVIHNPTATYRVKVLAGTAKLPRVYGDPIDEVHSQRTASITDRVLHGLIARPPVVRTRAPIRLLPR